MGNEQKIRASESASYSYGMHACLNKAKLSWCSGATAGLEQPKRIKLFFVPRENLRECNPSNCGCCKTRPASPTFWLGEISVFFCCKSKTFLSLWTLFEFVLGNASFHSQSNYDLIIMREYCIYVRVKIYFVLWQRAEGFCRETTHLGKQYHLTVWDQLECSRESSGEKIISVNFREFLYLNRII
mmetsp:Transcript_32935/g.77770  ORF Transcript_32935/g.77770 Transcript_32935/m.77770 type:complete len:185 (+) Transcript_32935:999-1553(+)